jgi:hypothetical protein
MKAFVIEKPVSVRMTEVVQPVAEDHQGVGSVKDHPTPQIAPDEVLVKVEFAASVRVCKLWRGL